MKRIFHFLRKEYLILYEYRLEGRVLHYRSAMLGNAPALNSKVYRGWMVKPVSNVAEWRKEEFASAREAAADLAWQIKELESQGFKEVTPQESEAEQRRISGIEPDLPAKPPRLKRSRAERLRNWWAALGPGWRRAVEHCADFAGEPGADEFAKIAALKEVIVTEDIDGDITPIAELENVRRASFYEVRITSLVPLAGLPELQDLDLYGCGLVSIEPLESIRSLRRLRLAANPELVDAGPLAHLPHLADLDISETGIEDLMPLKDCASLARLTVSQSSEAGQDIEKWSEILGASVITAS